MSNSAKELQGILGDQFSGSAIQLARSIDLFGLVVTDLLIRHKKGIVEHQFQLIRMAEAVIHIYAMVCALSRASAAFKENSPTANHEATLAKLACNYVGSFSLNFPP
ncbi:unnamed protein product [Protopolystoma xenopodis]|uniref:ACAD9/ACADV-like C-terminal domain-containing protein n=1 Tax=Protopolystoma xenopodis TaxID=117903 RepID=A0A3S5A4Q4_9PLAT|nr:unnamed protein product [Protopolystoma xenopodis]